jgi:hypothetical protein
MSDDVSACVDSAERTEKPYPACAQADDINFKAHSASDKADWANDATGHFKEQAKLVKDIIADATLPTVLAINAEWGSGKTFFLDGLQQDIQLDGRPWIAVKFDAWASDFTSDPFVPIAGELVRVLSELHSANTKLVEAAKQLGADLIDLLKHSSLSIGIASVSLPERSSTPVDVYNEECRLRESLRVCINKTLQDIARNVGTDNGETKLVVLVDELDRCRPTYALQVLERIKHVFNVRNVVFVIALNTDSLTETIKTAYGFEKKERADEYLQRFFTIRMVLSKPTPEQAIESIIGRLPFAKDSVIKTGKYNIGEMQSSEKDKHKAVVSFMVNAIRAKHLSFRQVQRLMESFYLAEKLSPKAVKAVPDYIMALLIIRMVEPKTISLIREGHSFDQINHSFLIISGVNGMMGIELPYAKLNKVVCERFVDSRDAVDELYRERAPDPNFAFRVEKYLTNIVNAYARDIPGDPSAWREFRGDVIRAIEGSIVN